jgi:ABC-type transporter Mla subunit MlaD
MVGAMKHRSTLSRALRTAAVGVLLAGFGLWLGTGAHRGWTQTSVVTLQKDEITGIDYPVRRDAFIAGIEVPSVAIGLAALLAALSFLPGRRPAAATA